MMDFYLSKNNKKVNTNKQNLSDEEGDSDFVNIVVNQVTNVNEEHIPCLYLPNDDPVDKILIYFHANAEDIGVAFDLLCKIGEEMGLHVIAVEYPGYGLYKSSPPDENKMKEDAIIIYDYLTTVCGIKEENVLLYGRSMGSGPSTYISSVRNPQALILMSAYKSI